MSKTVKRVMTVTMIGLVAFLGAKAEAHTRWINGKPRNCSIEATAKVKVPKHWPAGHFALATLTLTAKAVEITCENGVPAEAFKGKRATLIGESLEGKDTGAWIYDRDGNATLTFDIDPLEHIMELGFCAGSKPTAAQVTNMDVEYKLSDCGNDPVDPVCLNSVLLSTMKYTDCKPGDKLDDDKCIPYDCEQAEENPIRDEAHPGPLFMKP